MCRLAFSCSIFIFFLTYFAEAQIDRRTYNGLTERAQFDFIDQYLTKHWFDFYDSTNAQVVSDYNLMRELATSPQTACLLRLFWFRNQSDRSIVWERGYQPNLNKLRAILDYAHQNNLKAEEGICWLAWSITVLAHQDDLTERARRIIVYDGALRGLNLLESLPRSVLNRYHGATYDLDYHLQFMSTYFFRLEEYELARRVASLGNRTTHPVYSTKAGHLFGYNFYKWHFLNELGSCHLQLGELREAMHWYQQAHVFGKVQQHPVREAISYGNIGLVLSRQGQVAAAIPYLERAASVTRQDEDLESEFNATAPLAQLYLKANRFDKAELMLHRAVTLYDSLKHHQWMAPIDSTGATDLFTGLGQVYQYKGDVNKALFYAQLANRLAAKRRETDDSRRFRLKQEKLELAAYTARINQIEADRSRAIWLRNLGLLVLALVLTVSLLYLAYYRRRRREAEEQLALLADQARERTRLLDQLQQTPQTTPSPAVSDDTLSHMAELMESAILTEADWDRFRKLFERVYPNYILRLRKKYDTLTPAETRLICLSRLSLSTKEMADMLGVSQDTVVKTRYRIRKKTELPEGADLGDAFASV